MCFTCGHVNLMKLAQHYQQHLSAVNQSICGCISLPKPVAAIWDCLLLEHLHVTCTWDHDQGVLRSIAQRSSFEAAEQTVDGHQILTTLVRIQLAIDTPVRVFTLVIAAVTRFIASPEHPAFFVEARCFVNVLLPLATQRGPQVLFPALLSPEASLWSVHRHWASLPHEQTHLLSAE